MKKMTFVIDLDRCLGCYACQVACKMENSVGLGSYRTKLKTVGPTGTYPDIQLYFMAVPCQHCENPACAAVCPTGACYRSDEDGVVHIDKDVCIGCKSCAAACPYEANTFNREMRIMDKCDVCAERRKNGEAPACVSSCPGRALHVGDINDPESEVSRLLRDAGEENVYSLRDFGNGPSVKYILRNARWQDVLPQDCKTAKRGRE